MMRAPRPSGKIPMAENSPAAPRELARNRRARHDLEIVETLEAGLILVGTEVKSIRAGRISLDEAWVKVRADAVTLEKANVAEYAHGNVHNHEPARPRPLLVHRRQRARLLDLTQRQGLVAVPLRVLLRGRWLKLEIGLGRPKKLHDKRETARTRDAEREMRRAVKRRG